MHELGGTAQILDKIAAIESLTQMLSVNQSVSELDKDLLKKLCVELYESIIALPVSITQAASSEISEPTHPVNISTQEEIGLFASVHTEDTLVPVLNDIPEEPVIEEVPLNEVLPEPEPTETTITETIPDPVSETSIETKEETKNTIPKTDNQELPFLKTSDELLHEKMAKTVGSQPDLAQKFQSKVESLKAAITLNMKIAFVNDLFKENTVEYAKAIDTLNNASDLNDALRILGELKYHYSWDEQNEVFKSFENLVVKRYA